MRTATILVALCLALTVSAKLSNFEHQAVKGMWNSWKQEFGAAYEDAEEDEYRFKIFLKNLIYIEEYNANPENTARLSINKFANLTRDEFSKVFTGAIKQETDLMNQDNVLDADDDLSEDLEALPDSVDWRKLNKVTEVQNQGPCGDCWAFASVDSLNSLYMIEYDVDADQISRFSVQQVAACDTKSFGCNGGIPYTVFSYAAKYGLETAAEYPYNYEDLTCNYNKSLAYKNITKGGQVKKAIGNADALKAVIAQGPAAVVIQADQQVFQFYTSGVISSGCGALIDHAVLAVGYESVDGTDAFIIKNSWGANWGENGYVYISADEKANRGAGVCGILTLATYGKSFKN